MWEVRILKRRSANPRFAVLAWPNWTRWWSRVRSHIPVSRATQSLRGRLLLIVLVAMLPMIALLLFSGHSQSRDAQAARHMRLQNSAETAEEAVGREFQFALHVLSGLAEEVDPDASHLPASFQILIDENARASQSFLSVQAERHGACGRECFLPQRSHSVHGTPGSLKRSRRRAVQPVYNRRLALLGARGSSEPARELRSG